MMTGRGTGWARSAEEAGTAESPTNAKSGSVRRRTAKHPNYRAKSVLERCTIGYHNVIFSSGSGCSRPFSTLRPPIVRARRISAGYRFHVRLLQGLFLQRSRDRPRHGEHPDLCPRQGHRAERALRRRDPAGRRAERQARDPGSRHRREADARTHAGQHHGDPADEGRRDRRFHRHRADAEAVHQEGARVAAVLAVALASSFAFPAARLRSSAARSANRRSAPARRRCT